MCLSYKFAKELMSEILVTYVEVLYSAISYEGRYIVGRVVVREG